MTELIKNGVKMVARDGNQLAAFLNNGWTATDTVEKAVATEKKQYSKSEIQRMNTADLKELAPTLGIEVTEESTGAKLKDEIIAKLGL